MSYGDRIDLCVPGANSVIRGAWKNEWNMTGALRVASAGAL
jgi:hypothetical protein